MPTNKRGEGNIITVTAPGGGITSGQGLLVNSLFGVALQTVNAGENVDIETEGLFSLPKTGGVVSYAVGELCYWDDTGKVITKVSGGNTLLGPCAESATQAATTVVVKIG